MKIKFGSLASRMNVRFWRGGLADRYQKRPDYGAGSVDPAASTTDITTKLDLDQSKEIPFYVLIYLP